MIEKYIQKVLKKVRKSAIFLLAGLALFVLMSLGMVGRGWGEIRTYGLVERGGIMEPLSGGNGKADTTAAGDDVQVVNVGSYVSPGYIIIDPGPNRVVDTTPSDDDVLIGNLFTQTDTFNDGSVIYVKAYNGSNIGSTKASIPDGIKITDDTDVNNNIFITVYDDGSFPDDVAYDMYYWGKFTLKQGKSQTDDPTDILGLVDGKTASFSAGAGWAVVNPTAINPGLNNNVTAGFGTFTDHSNPFLAISVSSDPFSPDGDGINDSTNISVTVADSSTPIYGRVEIRDSSDVMVRNLYTPADGILSTRSYTWDGKYDTDLGGGIVSNGTYTVYVIALDNAENSSQQTTTVKVETTKPEISEVNVSPGTISPQNDDGVKDSSTITFKAVRTGGGLTFNIYDGATLVRDLTSSITVVGDHYSVTWDGKDDAGSYVDDGTYTCEIKATNVTDEETTNTEGTVTVDNAAPSAPTNLSATSLVDGGIKLTWTASSPETDVAQYNIYRANSSGGQDYNSLLANVSAGTTTYTDTATTDGVTYYYVVRAQDVAGNIETNTNEASTTAGITTGPSFSSITSSQSTYKDGDTITLTVTLENHNTGCTLTADFSNIDDQYVSGGESVVNWGTDGVDNDGDGHVDNPNEQGVYVISYLISTVNSIADSLYSISVTATDGAGNSASSSISLTLDNAAPSAPTNLSATSLVDGGIKLTWTASSSSDISQYNIYRATTSGGQSYSSPTYTVSFGTNSYTDMATTDGVTYYYVVRAQDTVGNIETNTNEVSAMTSGTTGPSPPTNLTATAIAGGSIKLTWTASSSSDVAQYNIYRATTSGGQSYSSPTYTVLVGTTTYTDTSTTDGVTYYYVVRAQDTVGNIETNTNEASATAGITTGPSFSSITSSQSTYKDGDTITLTVTLENHNTDCTLTADFSNIDDQYVSGGESVVNWGTDGVDNDGDGHVDNPNEQGVYVISYLISTVNSRADGSHSVPVTAIDGAGNSASSSISLTLDNAAPSASTNLSATALVDGSIKLTWTASSSSDISQYNIYRATNSGGQSYSSPTYTVPSGTTTYTDTSTTDGVTYYCVVRAQDAAGNIETNTNEVSATASVVGPSVSVSQIYVKYGEELLYDLASSTDSDNPAIFAKGKIDEVYLRLDLYGGFELNETVSSIALYKDVDENAEQIFGNQEINQGTGWAELIFHLDPIFNPDVDEHSQDGLYWVDASAVDTAGSTNNFDFYFIYDTISPSAPHFQISSFDSTTGSITVSGKTVPDELSDPQWVEIFVNDFSKGAVTAEANYEFGKSGIGLINGTNYIAVQSTDKAGNKSELSKSLKLNYNPESLLSIIVRSPHVVRFGSPTEPVKIIYSVTQPAEITIQIFNLRGEIVKEWNGSASPGEKTEWNWYGKNMYEEEVNNGIYIFRIKAQVSNGENNSVTKLVAVLR